MISKEKEAAGSDNERSSKASITKDPYYPYNQEWFGHDEEDADDLVKDWLIPLFVWLAQRPKCYKVSYYYFTLLTML